MSVKEKALVFYSYLPPWRIDIFNAMNEYYDLKIVFLNSESDGFTYNRDLLLNNLHVDSIFYNKGFNIGTKAFRLGIYNIVKKYKPDIVFTHEYSPTSVFLALLLRINIFNFRLIVTTSDNFKMAQSVYGLKKYFRLYVLNSANGVVVYSENVREWYKENFPHLKVEVCPNIQNPRTLLAHKKYFKSILKGYNNLFHLNKPIVLYIGRLEKIKGVDLLIEAFNNSLKETHQLVLVGEGSESQNLKNLVQKYNIGNSVIFTGSYYGRDLYAWYYLADFFVLPSRYEPFGAVVNEALIFGCPVLASKNIGALDYINEGNNGLIFDPENNESFVDTLFKASNSFTKGGTERDNLMLVSFNQYSKVFYKIAQP
ncbi:glycosyltransferase [Runella sp. SP2]|uniref:glycosyltransferase n=1 Tax=Runella sp. SP2 TaxID=2268026 RepID=UPI00197EFF09|nr:glycosyltransferase [Runella sp. SP2]